MLSTYSWQKLRINENQRDKARVTKVTKTSNTVNMEKLGWWVAIVVTVAVLGIAFL